MKAKHLLHAVTLALSACTTAATAEPVDVRLTITTETAGPRIEPEVYGHFAEHLGTGTYGGLWVGPRSKIPNLRGWRKDVVEVLRKLQVPVVRWPGGCFADDYDWRDGIGAPAKRPARLNKIWGNVIEPNSVGTHEFMDLADQLGAEAYIAGNMGSMPPRAMGQWLEYMTSDSKSALAEERRRNGRDKPWKVKYFGVGNESFGCGGHMRPEYQADVHNQYATFLHAPVVRVASGDGEGDDNRVEVLMQRSAKHMDALTLHYYSLPDNWTKHGASTGFDAPAWARTLKSAVGIEGRIEQATLHTPKWREGDVELRAVDASVARGEDGSLRIALVNLDPQRPARVQTNLTGIARGRLLTAATMDAHNTFALPNALVPRPYTAGAGAAALALEVPAKSVLVVTLPAPH